MSRITHRERLILQHRAYGEDRRGDGEVGWGEGWVEGDAHPSGTDHERYVLTSTRGEVFEFITRGTDGDARDFDVKCTGSDLPPFCFDFGVAPDCSEPTLDFVIGFFRPGPQRAALGIDESGLRSRYVDVFGDRDGGR